MLFVYINQLSAEPCLITFHILKTFWSISWVNEVIIGRGKHWKYHQTVHCCHRVSSSAFSSRIALLSPAKHVVQKLTFTKYMRRCWKHKKMFLIHPCVSSHYKEHKADVFEIFKMMVFSELQEILMLIHFRATNLLSLEAMWAGFTSNY